MAFDSIITELALIFAGAAALASLFVFFKQPIIISYIVLGMLIGPYGLSYINDAHLIEEISHIGIIFLLFLIGLNLPPTKLIQLFKKSSLITVSTCMIFAVLVTLITFAFGFGFVESLIVGLALMFSSTVVGLKLIPTTALHHKHIGELMVSVLLLQDILAILLIIFLGKASFTGNTSLVLPLLILKSALLVAFAVIFVKKAILKLLIKFDVIQEYVFVLAIGWCFLMAFMAKFFGLSYEIGAFIAGCSLAISEVSLVIAENFKNIREFFLILFFFAIGTQLDFLLLQHVAIPGIVLALIIVVAKPLVYRKAFKLAKEERKIYSDLSIRLGQASEFSMLVAYTALANNVIAERAGFLIQLTAILTIVISTYVVTLKLPTPISCNNITRQD